MQIEKTIIDDQIKLIRSQTSGCEKVIHLNNAGASLPADQVIETITDYLKEEAILGGYETEAKYLNQINRVYELVAELINAEKDEIALFENASAAWQTAFKGINFQPGDEILTCEMEYVSNLIGFVDIKNNCGVIVTVIPNDEKGDFSIEKLSQSISSKTRMIAVTHISSSGGGMVPIEAIGKIAKKHNLLYMVDACQSAGQYPLDVKEINCHILSATGRKYMRAPRGTGFLFVRKEIQKNITPLLLDFQAATNVSLDSYTLRQDARRFELYEKNRALILGLGKATEYILNIGIANIWKRVSKIAELTRNKLIAIPTLKLQEIGSQRSGIIAFTLKDIDSGLVKAKLAKRQINVSIGGSQATPIYMENRQLETIVRASVHYYNNEADIDTFVTALNEIVDEQAL